METAQRPGVQRHSAGRLDHGDLVRSHARIEINAIQADLVRLAVCQVDIDRERIRRIPGRGSAARSVRLLQSSQIGGIRCPRPAVLTGESDLRIRRPSRSR